MRIDSDNRQDYENFDLCLIEKKAREMARKHPKNRLVNHLVENCVLQYGCPAARNLVMGRWECPIPISRTCNANCLGCISEQSCDAGFVASHHRITFTPTAEEIAEYVVPHLENAERPVASFGQGCEGEPLLEGDLIADSISEIRRRTSRGIINLNTNGSLPDKVEKICNAGLDSIRISMSSPRENFYNAYHRPRSYSFSDVCESLRIVKKFKKWVSINYLIFPGFTDTPEEIDALDKLVSEVKLDMIQTRNLNIDPEIYIKKASLPDCSQDAIGMKNWVKHVKEKFPALRLGYFNPPLSVMKKNLGDTK
jgi:wyosine [tRNA(Phe)-imidazoG37] synthetase (radical SAM superfamily)